MVICHLDSSSSLLICTCPHPSPLTVFCKAQEWYIKNLRPHQSSPPSPLLTGVTPGSSCFVFSLTPLILTQLCSPASLSWTPWASPVWPLHLPLPLWGAASLGLPERSPSLRSAHSPSDQSPPNPVQTPFPPSVFTPLSWFPFPSCPQYLCSGYFPYHLSSTMEETLRALFLHNWVHSAEINACHIIDPQ